LKIGVKLIDGVPGNKRGSRARHDIGESASTVNAATASLRPRYGYHDRYSTSNAWIKGTLVRYAAANSEATNPAISGQLVMKMKNCAAAKPRPAAWRQLLAVPLMLAFLPAAVADSLPFPEFNAVYDGRVSGVRMAEASYSLRRLDNGDYLYRREMTSVGLASLFGKSVAVASSRWRFTGNWIQVQEFQSSDEDGDADDNLHLVFDWDAARVKNVASADPWQTEIAPGTLDKLAMEMALIFDLRAGSTEFQYPVARQGRIKQYRFEQTGTERIALPMGEFDALVVERLDDDRDRTTIWCVPELNYLPVRYLKQKQSGMKHELSLRQVEFSGQQAAD